PSEKIPGCIHGSLLADPDAPLPTVLGAAADGVLYRFDGETGAASAILRLPAPEGEVAFVVATPLLLGRRLVVAYHTIPAKDALPDVPDPRRRHRIAVVDLDRGMLDPVFPVFDLDGMDTTIAGGPVPFSAANALARSALVHLSGPGALGRVVVTF